MKKYPFCVSLMLAVCCVVAIVPVSSYAQSANPAGVIVQNDYQVADDELNRVYQAVRERHKNNNAFLQKLKESQRLWIQFRDAEVAMRYPAEDKLNTYGSVYPTCMEALLVELTEARTKTLRQWLGDAVEGDVCSGSVSVSR